MVGFSTEFWKTEHWRSPDFDSSEAFQTGFSEDMFFPPRDCAAEEALIPNSEFRVIDSVSGHVGLFGLEPTYIEQIDRHVRDVLAIDA